MFRPRSLRIRIAAAFALGSIIVTGLVGLATYVLISRTLTEGRRDTVVAQTFQGVRAARALIEQSAEPVKATELVTRLQRRGDVIVLHRGEWAQSSHVIDRSLVPSALRQAVREDHPAIAHVGDPRRIMVGTKVPGSATVGATSAETEVYFIFSLSAVDRTLGLVSKIFFAVIGVGAVFSGLAGWRLAAGTIRPLRLAAEAAHDVAEGNLDTRLEVTGEDELARLSAAFNRMTEALALRIGRERQFVADVSHELRTPLTALKTSIDYVANRSDELPERMRNPVALAADEVRSLQRLVDDLLELSRMESGGVTVEAEDIDLVDFAQQLARRRAPEADVRIHGPQGLVVRTDKMRLERVVGNLLENAVFHGGTNGVDLFLERTSGLARIVVSDRGPGIDPAKLPLIFERFYRGDASRSRDGRVGSGLGLAIARENATLIGADIGVQSEEGEGTIFEVRVPDQEAER